MEIHLLRHTPVDIANGICYGQTDVPLTSNYLNDFKQLTLLKKYDYVFSSPLSRCTAIAEYFKFVYKTDDRLKEMNFGDWEMKPWNDIPFQDIQPWYDDYFNVSTPNGESFKNMQARVLDFWQELNTLPKDAKVLIITHAGAIRIILGHIQQRSMNEIFAMKIPFGESHIFFI